MHAKTFALDQRVLICKNCGAPLTAPTSGGQTKCEYCDAVSQFAPRPALRPAPPSATALQIPDSVTQYQRIATLRNQVASYNATANTYAIFHAPPGLEAVQAKIVSLGYKNATLATELQAEFGRAVAQCEARPGEPTAGRRCYWLARLLSQVWSAQDQHLRQRAVLESASELLTDQGHQYILRTGLAGAAIAMGELDSAEGWLAQCDPNQPLLDQDSAYRVTAGQLALAKQGWGLALALVGPSEGEIPFEPSTMLLSSIIRVAALEGAGNKPGAETCLTIAASTHGREIVRSLLEVNDVVVKARETWSRLQGGRGIPKGPTRGRSKKSVLIILLIVSIVVGLVATVGFVPVFFLLRGDPDLDVNPSSVPAVTPPPYYGGACDRAAACCAAAGASPFTRGICDSVENVRASPMAEQSCQSQLDALRRVLSSTTGSVPQQCL